MFNSLTLNYHDHRNLGRNQKQRKPGFCHSTGTKELISHGHTLYVRAGASILPDIAAICALADMIIKVEEPIKPEYPLILKDPALALGVNIVYGKFTYPGVVEAVDMPSCLLSI